MTCPECGSLNFAELTPEAQKKVLLFIGIKAAEEANLDIFPLFVLPKPECNEQ